MIVYILHRIGLASLVEYFLGLWIDRRLHANDVAILRRVVERRRLRGELPMPGVFPLEAEDEFENAEQAQQAVAAYRVARLREMLRLDHRIAQYRGFLHEMREESGYHPFHHLFEQAEQNVQEPQEEDQVAQDSDGSFEDRHVNEDADNHP